jgi:hypothetical protein
MSWPVLWIFRVVLPIPGDETLVLFGEGFILRRIKIYDLVEINGFQTSAGIHGRIHFCSLLGNDQSTTLWLKDSDSRFKKIQVMHSFLVLMKDAK